MSAGSNQIRVAIVGGGAAGISLLHALLGCPHLDVHLFESGDRLVKPGAAIGLQYNVLRALELLSPTARECLDRAGMVPLHGHQIMLAEGPNAGEFVARTSLDGSGSASSRSSTSRENGGFVQREAFLQQLLAQAPAEHLHVSKKLTDILQKGELNILKFADGTSHTCDILIGSDGIHSSVRKYILGPDDPAASPVPAGWWAIFAIRPYEEARDTLGEELIDLADPVQYSWIGEGKWLMHNALSDGKQAQLVVVSCCEPCQEWQRSVSAEELCELVRSYPPNLQRAVKKLMCQQPTQPAFYLWEHLHARTYVKEGVAIMGDAAHATTPWQASGAGMSIEDALILSNLLKRATSPSEARIALQVYDEVRRPHTQRIVDSSRGTGKINTGVDPDTGLDLDKVRQKLPNRWDFIRSFDIPRHRDDAIELMESKGRTNKGSQA